MSNKILLFTPMYNCEKQILRVLGQMTDEVASFIDEWVIINNRSTDNGENAVIDYIESYKIPVKLTLLRNEDNYGLGGSHKVAFQYAIDNEFDYVIVLHGDDQGDISNIIPYLKSKEYENYDCMLGARFMKGSKLQGYSKFRTFGNRVFDCLFSIGCAFKVYDLGSGLNMYRVNILKDNFYMKYKDNLVFNCYMLLGHSQYKHNVKFFPIIWREDDQVSNVKMTKQAMTTLRLLFLYIFKRRKFLESEHRDIIIENYSANIVFSNK